jgi:DNA-binding SARP family transcriptional activator
MPQLLVDDLPDGSRLRLELLGGFRLTDDGRRLPLPSQARRLLAMIALNTEPVSRAFLAGTLWADTTEPKATAALRSALWKVRKYGDQIVSSNSYDVALGPSVEVDVRSLAIKAKRLVNADDDCDDLELDPAPLSQDLLPGWYEDWVLIERESLRQLFMHALEAMAARLSSAGDSGGAIQACLAAIGHETLGSHTSRMLNRRQRLAVSQPASGSPNISSR